MKDLENIYKYHASTEEQRKTYEELRASFKKLATDIESLCPEGREKSTAHTYLETAGFWANASVARGEVLHIMD
tara:strand:- start:10725 stop:10946 length:222 start_codon:yes stop_codon:yes gene_type:complete